MLVANKDQESNGCEPTAPAARDHVRARLRDLERAALRLLEQHFVQVVFDDDESSLSSEEEALVTYFLQHGVDTGPERLPFYRYVFQRLAYHYQELAEDWESRLMENAEQT